MLTFVDVCCRCVDVILQQRQQKIKLNKFQPNLTKPNI